MNHIASIDVETYSQSGHTWDPATQKWKGPKGSSKGAKGLPAVGAAAYAEHPTTDLLTLSYALPQWWRDLQSRPDWRVAGKRRWRPGLPLPEDLFAYLAGGWPIESHNAMFERLIWQWVLVRRYGWPPLNPQQQRCSMATARVDQYPAALANLSDVLRLPIPKDKEGKRLLEKYSVPRNPTKKDPRLRVLPAWMPGADPADDADFAKLEVYCDTDLDAEGGASERMEPMTPDELHFWLVDQEINSRGMGVDRDGVRACTVILDQLLERYGEEHRVLTGGLNPTQLEAVKGWLSAHGVQMWSMDEEAVTSMLSRMAPHPPGVTWPPRRALEIRQLTGSASVKKLYAMANQLCADSRLRNLLNHHGARTGRPTGEGPQPLNLPKAGPKLVFCAACSRPYHPKHAACPWCVATERKTDDKGRELKPAWKTEMVDSVLEIMAHGSLELVEWYFGDAALCISGCLRGLFVAAPGHELIASDYSAIEAVVIAMLAGEQWRIDAFRRGDPIYLVGASKITGTPLEVYLEYKEVNGDHHPDRQYVGKVSELALGFKGWINAWRAMEEQQKKDNPSFVSPFSDDDIKRLILAWWAASPAIVEFWGGQHRGKPWDRDRTQEFFGVEGHAVLALLHPGVSFTFRGITFYAKVETPAREEWRERIWTEDPTRNPANYDEFLQEYGYWGPGYVDIRATHTLVVRLPSGRELFYRNATLSTSSRDASEYAITYWTWNSNPKYGSLGWGPMATFGGRLTENIVQAVAHDIMRYAVLQLRSEGYHTILHVYDEIVAEIPIGTGSVEAFEAIMMRRPPWASDWPIVADGGWRGRRYRKG